MIAVRLFTCSRVASWALTIIFAPAIFAAGDDSTGPPNLIILLADDMGYADPGCFGGKAVRTPNLDALAKSGMRFTQFYAASGVCTPTRVSVLTGRYPLRFDVRRHFRDEQEHLPPGTVTLPKLLKQAGYLTGHVGKWHLGGLHQAHIRDRANSMPGPHQHGFDHYLCQNEEQPQRGVLGRERQLYRKGGTCLIRDEKNVPHSDPYYNRHFTDINGDESVRLIEKFHRSGRPFFLNVWWLVPHMPYEPAPEPHFSRYADPNISEDQHCFRSMVSQMDHKIGLIVAKLEELRIRDRTFILFTSDNGGAYQADVGPFKGGKTDLHEGGIRVPMIASWPGIIPAGTVSDTLGHTNDILPTFLAAAGAAIPAEVQLDGLNLLPHLTEIKPITNRGTVFWQMDLYNHLQRQYPKPKPYATEVARRGRWKLLARDGKPVELVDIQADPYETVNLLGRQPHIEAELTDQLKAFLAAPRRGWQ